MMYKEFEKLNCQHIKELDIQNKTGSVLQYRMENDIQVLQLNMCDGLKLNDKENELRMNFINNKACLKRDNDTSDLDLCHGYECDKNSFYQQPDVLNTYHNYLVIQDELHDDSIVTCTENHQYFNNWTNRKMPKFPCPRENTPNYIFNYYEELPKLEFNECPQDKIKYMC